MNLQIEAIFKIVQEQQETAELARLRSRCAAFKAAAATQQALAVTQAGRRAIELETAATAQGSRACAA